MGESWLGNPAFWVNCKWVKVVLPTILNRVQLFHFEIFLSTPCFILKIWLSRVDQNPRLLQNSFWGKSCTTFCVDKKLTIVSRLDTKIYIDVVFNGEYFVLIEIYWYGWRDEIHFYKLFFSRKKPIYKKPGFIVIKD